MKNPLFEIPDTSELSVQGNILVIGTGGGASNVLRYLYRRKERWDHVDFLAIHTGAIIRDIPVNSQLIIDKNDYSDEIKIHNAIKNKIGDRYRLIIDLTCLGGSSCINIAPIVAKSSKELSSITLSVASMPFSLEGQHRRDVAEKGFSLIKKYVDSIFLLSNDFIVDNNKSLHLVEAFNQSDMLFSMVLDVLYNTIYKNGIVNIDFNDISNVLSSAGLASFTFGIGRGERRVDEAVNNLNKSAYLEDVDLKKINNILLQIEYGKKELTMEEVVLILDNITDKFRKDGDVDIIWGTFQNDDIDDEVIVKVILTGVFELKNTPMPYEYKPEDYIIERAVPIQLKDSVTRIKNDHKGKSIGFLIMKFGTGGHYKLITDYIRSIFSNFDIVILRADDKQYHEDLHDNIMSYIHAADFGIAVFERISDDQFNPNVAYEVGYMRGINKKVCLLKEKTMKSLPTDIIGKIYREFDLQNIEETLKVSIEKWLYDHDMKK